MSVAKIASETSTEINYFHGDESNRRLCVETNRRLSYKKETLKAQVYLAGL